MRVLTLDFASISEARGAVVVVDVLRACTTAALALASGVREILVADTASAARLLAYRHPDALLAGEVAGVKPPDFDLPNSPAAFGASCRGRRLVLASGAGTPALVRAAAVTRPVLAAAFVNATATARALTAAGAETVSFIVSGTHCGWSGDEDRACAEYVLALLRGAAPDPRPYLARVRASVPGRNLLDPAHAEFAPADLACALAVDCLDFAVVARRRDDVLVLGRA